MFEMGACMSSNNEEAVRKKHSQAIDKQLEEDSKRLRRECKILLLGMIPFSDSRWLVPRAASLPSFDSFCRDLTFLSFSFGFGGAKN